MRMGMRIEMSKNRGMVILWMETGQKTYKTIKNIFKEKLMKWENVHGLIDISIL